MSTSSLEWTSVIKKPPKNIILPTTSRSNHHKSPLELEAERNERDQMKIDMEVLITGFPTQPHPKTWQKLIKEAGIEERKVAERGIFQAKSGSFCITIGFKDKTSQEQFVKEINNKTIEKTRINVHKRLTKFNSQVEKELKDLKRTGGINGLRLNGFIFEAKLSYATSWLLIDTQHALTRFIADAKNYLIKDEQAEKRDNFKEQIQFDRQICIHNFTSKPQNIELIITKFLAHFNLQMSQVVSHSVQKDQAKWKIFVEFAEKSAQRKVLTAKARDIRESDLTGFRAAHLPNPIINWKRPLTNFNEKVNKILTEAHMKDRIEKFEFSEHRFKVKVEKSSPWVVIECLSDLDKVLRLKKGQQGVVKGGKLYKMNSVESLSTTVSSMSMNSEARNKF